MCLSLSAPLLCNEQLTFLRPSQGLFLFMCCLSLAALVVRQKRLQVEELSGHVQSPSTEHIRFSVHGRGRDHEFVEILNTGMMEMCEFMDVRPGRPRAPRHGCSEILLDFGDEVHTLSLPLSKSARHAGEARFDTLSLPVFGQGRMMLTFSRHQEHEEGNVSVRLTAFQMHLTRQVSGWTLI